MCGLDVRGDLRQRAFNAYMRFMDDLRQASLEASRIVAEFTVTEVMDGVPTFRVPIAVPGSVMPFSAEALDAISYDAKEFDLKQVAWSHCAQIPVGSYRDLRATAEGAGAVVSPPLGFVKAKGVRSKKSLLAAAGYEPLSIRSDHAFILQWGQEFAMVTVSLMCRAYGAVWPEGGRAFFHKSASASEALLRPIAIEHLLGRA